MTTTEFTDPTPAQGLDSRLAYVQSQDLAGTILAGVAPSQLEQPTPCPEFTVRDLLGHIAYVARRVAAAGRGEDMDAISPVAGPAVDVAAFLTDEFQPAAEEAAAVWSDPSLLERETVLPWATMPGAAVLDIYTFELVVHSWDLAVATAQTPAWDAALVAHALAAGISALGEERPEFVPFAAPVSVARDAAAIDALVAWSGRRPTWPN